MPRCFDAASFDSPARVVASAPRQTTTSICEQCCLGLRSNTRSHAQRTRFDDAAGAQGGVLVRLHVSRDLCTRAFVFDQSTNAFGDEDKIRGRTFLRPLVTSPPRFSSLNRPARAAPPCTKRQNVSDRNTETKIIVGKVTDQKTETERKGKPKVSRSNLLAASTAGRFRHRIERRLVDERRCASN